MAKAFSPAVLTANDLMDGDAVWWTGSEWSRDVSAALVADDEAARAEMAAFAASPAHEATVVGPYLVDVKTTSGAPYPTVRREAIRADREPTFAYGEAKPLSRAA